MRCILTLLLVASCGAPAHALETDCLDKNQLDNFLSYLSIEVQKFDNLIIVYSENPVIWVENQENGLWCWKHGQPV